jgi:TolA-binding protein
MGLVQYMMGKCFISTLLFALFCLSSAAQNSHSSTEEQDYLFCHGLFKDGQYQIASGELEKFLRSYPESVKREEVSFLFAECLYQSGQYDRARQKYESFLTSFPSSTLTADVMFRLGEVSYGARKYEQAAARFRRVREVYPDRDLAGEASYWLGESYYRLGNNTAALDAYNVSLTRYPANALADYAMYSTAWIQKEQRQYVHARKTLQNLLDTYPASPLAASARVRIGECLFLEGQYRESAAYLTGTLESLPDSNSRGEAEYLAGECYFAAGDFGRAAEQYKHFLDTYPGHRLERDGSYSLGWTYLKVNKLDAAMAIFADLSQGSDNVAQAALFRKALAEKQAGNMQNCAISLSDVLRRWPEGAYADNAMFELAVLDYEQKDFASSTARLNDLLTSFPGSELRAEALRMQGEVYLSEENYGAAAKVFAAASSDTGAPPQVLAEALFQEGWSLHKQKRYGESSARFERFLKLYSTHQRAADAAFWLGESYYLDRKPEKARSAYQTVVTQYNTSPRLADGLYGLGWTSIELKDYQTAVKSFSRITQEYPGNNHAYDAYLRLGDAHMALKDFSRAAATYRKAISLFGSKKGIDYAYYQLAQANQRGDAPEKALTEYRNLLKKYPESAYADDAQFGIGWVSFQRKNFQQAIEEFNLLITKYPSSDMRPRTYYAIGDARYNLKEYRKAIDAYREVLNRYPASPYTADAVNGILYCFSALGDDSGANTVIDAFVRDNPGSPMADNLLLKKGEYHQERKQYEQAVRAYQSFLSSFGKSPLVPEAYFHLGECFNGLGMRDKAASAFAQVADRHAGHALTPAALMKMAEISRKREDHAGAIATLDRLMKEYPESDPARGATYVKGAILSEAGRTGEAEALFRTVIKDQAGTVFADKALVGLAMIEYGSGRRSEALESLRSVAAKRTDETGAEAQFRIGEILTRESQWADAVPQLMRVKYVYPSATDWIGRAYLRLGECYEKLDENVKAREAYQTVLSSHGDDDLGREAGERMKGLR